jgi:hypothetical protein
VLGPTRHQAAGKFHPGQYYMKYLFTTILVLMSGTSLFPNTPFQEQPIAKHNLGIEYGTNFFGNIGRITYSYDFSEILSFRASTGMGYLSLDQELAGSFGRVGFSQDYTQAEVNVFIQQITDIGLSLHLYKMKNINFFRNFYASLSHVFLNFEHKYFDSALQTAYAGRKNFSIWGTALGADIFEHQISRDWHWAIGARLAIFFMPTPQSMTYRNTQGQETELDFGRFDGEPSTWWIYYPELYLSFTHKW